MKIIELIEVLSHLGKDDEVNLVYIPSEDEDIPVEIDAILESDEGGWDFCMVRKENKDA